MMLNQYNSIKYIDDIFKKNFNIDVSFILKINVYKKQEYKNYEIRFLFLSGFIWNWTIDQTLFENKNNLIAYFYSQLNRENDSQLKKMLEKESKKRIIEKWNKI